MVPVHRAKQPSNSDTPPQSQRTSSVSSLGSNDSRLSYVSNVTGFEAELSNLKEFLTNGFESSELPSYYGHSNAQRNSFHKLQEQFEQLRKDHEILKRQRTDLQHVNQTLVTRESLSVTLVEQMKEEHIMEQAKIKGQLSYHLLDLESKATIIETLKNTISEQYCLVQDKATAIDSLEKRYDDLVTQLTAVRKSGDWYKDELHRCQQQKADFHRRLLALEQEMCHESAKTRQLEGELRITLRQSQEVETNAVREKTTLLLQLEDLHTALSARNVESPEKHDPVCQGCLFHAFTIDDLKQQVISLTKAIDTCQNRLCTVESDNGQMQSTVAIVQTSLADKLVLIATLEDYIKRLEEERSSISIKCQQLQKQNELLLDENCKINAATTLQVESMQKDKNIAEQRLATVEQELRQNCYQAELFEKELSEARGKVQTAEKSVVKAKSEFTSLNDNLKAALISSASKQKEIDQLRHQNHEQAAELQDCQTLIEKYEQEKSHIEENIAHLTQSSISDRNKYELIKVEKEGLSSKLLLLNEQLHRIKTDHLDVIPKAMPVLMLDIACQGEINDDAAELKHLKTLMKVLEKEHREKHKRHELNVRTLLKKVTEHMRGRKFAEEHFAAQNTVITSLTSKLAAMEQQNESLQRDLQNLTIESQKISEFLLFHNLPSKNVLDALTTLIANATQNAQTIQLLKSSILAKDLSQIDLQSQIERLQCYLNDRQIQYDSLSIIATDKVAECDHLNKCLQSIQVELDNNRNLQSCTKALETALAIERMKLQRQIKENEALEISVGNFTKSHERMKAELEVARQQRPITLSTRISLQNPLVDNPMGINQSDVKNGGRTLVRRLDMARVSKILEENAKSAAITLDPLEKCIQSLKVEMSALDVVIRENGKRRGEMSLMEELSICGGDGLGA